MDYKDVLAKCYVTMAEVDYDLREWAKANAKDGSWVSIVDANRGDTSGTKKDS